MTVAKVEVVIKMKKPLKKQNTFWNMKPNKATPFLNIKPMKSKIKVNLRSVNFVSPVNLKSYPARTKREVKLIDRNPWGDSDKDKVPNIFDCRPLDKKKQGWKAKGHQMNRERSTYIKMMKPEKFLKTTYIEAYDKTSKYQPENIEKYMPDFETYKKSILRPENVERLKRQIRHNKSKVEIPFLDYDIKGRPTGHEGRHRAAAAQELGIKLIPVTIARTLKSPRDWKKIRDEYPKYTTRTKKDWRNNLETTQEQISSVSADIPIQQQREYGVAKPEAIKGLPGMRKKYYHGTSSQRVPEILEKGLLPLKYLAKSHRQSQYSNSNYVYLTEKPYIASNWATSGTKGYLFSTIKDGPVVLEVEPPEEKLEKDTEFTQSWKIKDKISPHKIKVYPYNRDKEFSGFDEIKNYHENTLQKKEVELIRRLAEEGRASILNPKKMDTNLNANEPAEEYEQMKKEFSEAKGLSYKSDILQDEAITSSEVLYSEPESAEFSVDLSDSNVDKDSISGGDLTDDEAP